MSYDNDRYGGSSGEGNYGGGSNNNNNNQSYGGGRGDSYGGNNDSYGGQSGRRDDESGRDELRQHGQTGYGSVGGPGGYGRGNEGYGGPGGRVSSDNPESRYGGGSDEGRDNRRHDEYSGGNSGSYGGGNSGGYGGDNDSYGGRQSGGNGGHGHSSGTSYGDVPGGSDDYSSAAHTAAQHAGSSGDANLFSMALGMLSGHKAQQEDFDEQDAVKQHQQFYGGGQNPHPASSGSMGSAAALQALKMFNSGGNSAANSGGKNDFIGLAMSQAAKLFDEQSSQGNVHQNASKQDAISSAGQMALKMYLKSQGGGSSGGGGGGGLMSLASKFLR